MSEDKDTGLYAGLMLSAPEVKTPPKRKGSKREKEQLGRILNDIAKRMPVSPPTVQICYDCKEWFPVNVGTWVQDGDRFVCHDCRDEHYFKCARCGDYEYADNACTGSDDCSYCQHCFDDKFICCEKCGETMSVDNSCTGADDCSYCQSCFGLAFVACAHCARTMERDDNDGVELDGDLWCRRCAERYLAYCVHCEEYHHNDDSRNHRDGWQGCVSCYDEYCNGIPDGAPNEGTQMIHDHTYKPTPIYFRTEKDEKLRPDQRAYLGFELEVEAVTADHAKGAKDVTEMSAINGNQLFYCKWDGSLSNGFEVVSHPMTRDFIFNERKGAKKMIAEAITMLRRSGFRSYNTTTCGLHFHLSRKHFEGTFHLFKFLRFWYAMDKAFVVSVSGRSDERSMQQYCSLTDNEHSSAKEACIYKSKEKYGRNRYQAVNLCNRHTIEVRIFKGTLNVDSFFRKAELMFAAIEFTRQAPHTYVLDDFFRWVNEHYKEYPYSFGWLTSKRLIVAVKQEEEIACA